MHLSKKLSLNILQGTIEEKIYQRQISKQGLNSVVDFDNNQMKGNSSVKFSIEELRDLFTLSENTSCETHDLLSCDCGGSGVGISCLLVMISLQLQGTEVHVRCKLSCGYTICR